MHSHFLSLVAFAVMAVFLQSTFAGSPDGAKRYYGANFPKKITFRGGELAVISLATPSGSDSGGIWVKDATGRIVAETEIPSGDNFANVGTVYWTPSRTQTYSISAGPIGRDTQASSLWHN